jgi:VIT1/CCC1 family predicted Fe2+/Mn2+ transporter
MRYLYESAITAIVFPWGLMLLSLGLTAASFSKRLKEEIRDSFFQFIDQVGGPYG